MYLPSITVTDLTAHFSLISKPLPLENNPPWSMKNLVATFVYIILYLFKSQHNGIRYIILSSTVEESYRLRMVREYKTYTNAVLWCAMQKLFLPSFNSKYLNSSSHIRKDKENIALALSPHRFITDNDLIESYNTGFGKVHWNCSYQKYLIGNIFQTAQLDDQIEACCIYYMLPLIV